jgi:glyceraldehyde-3-phosphate dehydrogenase (NAD(P))
MGMRIEVGIIGCDATGKRVAEAVVRQPDMRLRGVSDSHASSLLATCAVAVNTTGVVIDGPAVVHTGHVGSSAPLFTVLSDAIFGERAVKVPSADVVGFARLVYALRDLGPIVRFHASILAPPDRDAPVWGTDLDALWPVFDEHRESEEAARLFHDTIPAFHIGRVHVPVIRSHLHMTKIDFARPPDRETVLALLRRGPRLLVASGRDGFPSTAHVQEFYRDHGRPRADRPELFVWEEALAVRRASVFLMLDVSPEATSIPEIIDAIRLRCTPGLSMADTIARTDAALGMRTGGQNVGQAFQPDRSGWKA